MYTDVYRFAAGALPAWMYAHAGACRERGRNERSGRCLGGEEVNRERKHRHCNVETRDERTKCGVRS